MIQKEFFEKANTDHLLSLRYTVACYYPVFEGQVPHINNANGKLWLIDKTALYEELKTRPHRIRAKERRKNGVSR